MSASLCPSYLVLTRRGVRATGRHHAKSPFAGFSFTLRGTSSISQLDVVGDIFPYRERHAAPDLPPCLPGAGSREVFWDRHDESVDNAWSSPLSASIYKADSSSWLQKKNRGRWPPSFSAVLPRPAFAEAEAASTAASVGAAPVFAARQRRGSESQAPLAAGRLRES